MTPPYPYNSLPLVDENNRHWIFKCVFHEETQASFVVNKTEPFYLYYRCFGCGQNGSATKFARLYLGHEKETIIKALELDKRFDNKYMKVHYECPKINWKSRLTNQFKISTLARKVGVSVQTIEKFRVCYSFDSDRWLIPMYDETGICGIQETWFERGERKKKCQRYSKHGIFETAFSFQGTPVFYIPSLTDHRLFICEGWSDTTVMVELGYWAIGRFNALDCSNHIVNMCNQNEIEFPTYIITDMDKCGIQGSKKLQRLILNSKILYPFGYPDIRAKFLKEGAEQTKKWIEENL